MNYTNPYEQGAVLLINKPYDWTSFDVVRKLRNAMRIKKVGHAGTLDPLATGLLILCTGKFTKRINEFMAMEKEYTGTMILGSTTSTYDLESEPEDHKSFSDITPQELHEAARQFTGLIDQVPPKHSAIKIGGKPVYILARKGKEVQLEPRKVVIKVFEVTPISLPEVRFRVVCSTGTYIRSLVHDFGQFLQCGAYLSELCRTRIGNFLLEDAITVEEALSQIQAAVQKG